MRAVRALAVGLPVLLAALAAGCPQRELRPVEVVLNEDACCVCLMAVSSREFAAETISPDGTVEYYDDPGCLLDRARRGGLPEGSASFVVDLEGGAWLACGEAWYLWSPDLPTPMSYGIAAFGTRDAAASAALKYSGRVIEWPVLVEEFDPGN